MTIFDEFQAREHKIWNPFGFSMRFTDVQAQERITIFGLYSGAYKNGLTYLIQYEAFELGLIVDDYNSKLTQLDADEQNALLDIATKLYLANIETLIHSEELDTKRADIAATNAGWDAKFAALSADRAAIETMRLKFVARQKEIAARIQTLQAQILIEEVNLELATADVLKRELAVSQAENRLAGKLVELASKDVEIAEKDIALARKDIESLQKDIELLTKSSDLKQLELKENQTELSITEVGIDVLRIQNQVIETGLKTLDVDRDAANMGIQEARYETDISKTALIQADLIEVGAEKTINEVALQKKALTLLEVDLDARETELKKKQVDLEYVKVDQQVAGINIDVERTKAKIAETATIEAQKLLEEARLSSEQAKLSIYDTKGLMLDNKLEILTNETDNKESKLASDAAIHTSGITNINTKNQLKLDTLNIQEEESFARYDEMMSSAELDGELIELTRDPYSSMTDKKIATISSRTYASEKIDEAHVAALEKIMAAEITTNLMHSVSKA